MHTHPDPPWTPLACWSWGILSAQRDVRTGTVHGAVGAGLWAGVPHTAAFWEGYTQYCAHPEDRARYVTQARRIGRAAGGATASGPEA